MRKLEQYLLHENGREEWLDASDASPSCNREAAQRRANRYQLPVLVREVRGQYDKPLLYRVEPEVS